MDNKTVGWIIIGISAVMAVIVWIFNYSLKKIVGETCTHGPACTMYDTVSIQTWISLSIVAIILIIGLVIMFTKPRETIVIKKVKEREKKKKLNLEGLDKKEKELIEMLQKENGSMFQADLMEKLNTGKVGITRLLDKLEAKQIIERKRRGMNNIVVLRNGN
jgi:uncharacterized membrane protein